MCGIIGYIGARKAQPILLNSLGKLEYRGYDSCGIAVATGDDALGIHKDLGRVKDLVASLSVLQGTAGIGHTRWATHGEPSALNAHPHGDCTGMIAVVHNGTINNYQRLREQLAAEGHTLVSETDTEVIPHLIEKHYQGDLLQAVREALREIEGSFTMIALMDGGPRLVAARKESPLLIGIGDGENYIASDVPAILDYTSRVIYLEDDDIAVVTAAGVEITSGGVNTERKEDKITWSVADAQKGGYEHFMLKEIHEQPKVTRETLAECMSTMTSSADLAATGSDVPENILILASGTSYHSGLIGKYIIEELVQTPVRVEYAHEFNYAGRALTNSKAIVITQSGETTDAFKAIRRLKEVGCEVVTITNVVGSTASRLADQTVYTHAGPEISVAATKTHLAQIVALYWLAIPYSRIDIRKLDELIMDLRQLPVKIQQVLDNEKVIREHARQLAEYDHAFFIGRGINYPVALEGALKLKEVSYLHAEGYAAGELKHGPFALLGTRTPVVAVVVNDDTYEAVLTNIKEIKARKSPLLALVEEGNEDINALADAAIFVPKVDPLFSPVVNTVVLQLIAYYVAKERGCPIDFPRNLAKTVTVE